MPARHYPADDPARTLERYPADAATRPYHLDFGSDRDDAGRYPRSLSGAPADPYRPARSLSPYGDRDRYADRDEGRDRYDSRDRHDNLDRADNRDRYDSRDRYDNRDRHDNRDRADNRDRYDSGDRYDGRDRDRYRGRDDRDQGRDRNQSRDRYDGRDRGRDGSRDRSAGRARTAGRSRRGPVRPGRGVERSSGAESLPPRRSPWLLRGTLIAALLVAVAASVVRAGAGSSGGRGNQATLVLGSGRTSSAIQTVTPAPSAAAAGRASDPAAGANPAMGPPLSPSASRAAVHISCTVRYGVTSRTADRFTAVIALGNTGPAPLQDWTLRWATPPGVQLSDGWNAQVGTDAAGALAHGAGTGVAVPSGGSTTIGFVGTLPAGTARPGAADPTRPLSEFTLNGVKCR